MTFYSNGPGPPVGLTRTLDKSNLKLEKDDAGTGPQEMKMVN